jgi:hypothetical protein
MKLKRWPRLVPHCPDAAAFKVNGDGGFKKQPPVYAVLTENLFLWIF